VRPRIALVCSEVIRESGHGRYMLELARRFATTHEVHVYSNLFDPVPGVVYHHVPAVLGINLLRVYTFWLGASIRLLGAQFDIVHTVGGCCARRDVVTVQFAQRPWGAELHKLSLLDKHARAKGQAPVLVGSRLRRLYHGLYWRACDLLEAPAFRALPGRRIIAVSSGVRRELGAFYGTPETAVGVIYNGVDPQEWSESELGPLREPTRRAMGLGPEERVLLFVGDFYRKGLAVAIAALAATKDLDTQLLVVGRGETAAFREQAVRLGVGSRLHFVGFQRDVRPYFAAADAFVFPTRYEPFGMVVTEAMAAGLPVITTALAGASEIITPGVNGLLLADPEDADALASAVRYIFSDAARAREMAAAARLTAREVDWDYVARATLAVYRTLPTKTGAVWGDGPTTDSGGSGV
jgi:glycosyltransferase involved in cell wall biosynthesis